MISEEERPLMVFHQLPPSAKFILYVLKHNGGEMSFNHIYKETQLPRRTISYGLGLLEERGFVERFDKKGLKGRGRRVDRRFKFWRLLYGS